MRRPVSPHHCMQQYFPRFLRNRFHSFIFLEMTANSLISSSSMVHKSSRMVSYPPCDSACINGPDFSCSRTVSKRCTKASCFFARVVMIGHLGLPRRDRTHESSHDFCCLHGVTLFHLTLYHETLDTASLYHETLEVLT